MFPVAADAIGGGRGQDTAMEAGEATQEQSVVDSSCTEAARDFPGVASQAKGISGISGSSTCSAVADTTHQFISEHHTTACETRIAYSAFHEALDLVLLLK